MGLDILIIIVLTIFISFCYYAYTQLKLARIKVSDFVKFVYSSEKISELYIKARYFDILSSKDQDRFIRESKELFENFDKIPRKIWYDDIVKYNFIEKKYNMIKLKKWKNNA